MIYVELPETPLRRLTFYLAMEEYVARNFDAPEYFFMWQVQPTVIFGRNQLIEAEVNIEYCKNNGISTYRRKSGGGCVYADMSNIMFSYISADTAVRFTFDKYLHLVAHMLHKLGINARASGRNDIMIGTQKVSGNAFYHLPDRSIVHGTMLFNTDISAMVKAISPSPQKITSKGVKSVRQHVTNLSEHIDISIGDFMKFVRHDLCGTHTLTLGQNDIDAISEIEKEYLSPQFIFGNNPAYTTTITSRIEGAGEFKVDLEIKNNTIRQIDIKGDFFITGDIDNQIINRLKGVEYSRHAVEAALNDADIESTILNLNKNNLINLIFKP